jgi:hypothetical protein
MSDFSCFLSFLAAVERKPRTLWAMPDDLVSVDRPIVTSPKKMSEAI